MIKKIFGSVFGEGKRFIGCRVVGSVHFVGMKFIPFPAGAANPAESRRLGTFAVC